MRKVLIPAAVAGALLMTGAGTASASPGDAWTATAAGASAQGTESWEKAADGKTMLIKTGTLTVTDPKACYYVQVASTPPYKPRPIWIWGTRSAKQCGPGKIAVTTTVELRWENKVRICKNDECEPKALAGSAL